MQDPKAQQQHRWNEESFPAHPIQDENLNAEELEQAYLRALETLEASEALSDLEFPDEQDSFSDSLSPSVISPGESVPDSEENPAEDLLPVSPAQVIESILFVGGAPLTAKKIAGLFDAHVDHFLIEAQIEQLNNEYREQNRPYEIRLGEGGYRMSLRPEYESIRNKVYGIGPREVRLSQDALEVLAFVAYRQPVSHQSVLESGKKNVGNLVRQLIRRELVIIERPEDGSKSVAYRTTSRFLNLFGLSSVEELPQVDELSLK